LLSGVRRVGSKIAPGAGFEHRVAVVLDEKDSVEQ